MCGFDICEFPDFDNDYGIAFSDWIEGLEVIFTFLSYNSGETMKLHEYISNEDKEFAISYGVKVVSNKLNEITVEENSKIIESRAAKPIIYLGIRGFSKFMAVCNVTTAPIKIEIIKTIPKEPKPCF
jgi:hypothetical protein